MSVAAGCASTPNFLPNLNLKPALHRLPVPFSWVAADSVYGVGDIEQVLRRAGKGYILGVNANHHFGSWTGKPAVAGTADEIARSLNPSAWRRLSAGAATLPPWTRRRSCPCGWWSSSPSSCPDRGRFSGPGSLVSRIGKAAGQLTSTWRWQRRGDSVPFA